MRSILAGLVLSLAVGSVSAQESLSPVASEPMPSEPMTESMDVGPATPDARDEAGHLLTKSDVGAWLDGFMPYAIGRGDIPGAVVVVVKDGQILLARGYGYADAANRVPVDPATTLFRVGSVSKLATWTAVMQLVEQGKLDLDVDVNQYLDFSIPLRDGKYFTLRDIMTHTSGIEEHARGLITSNPENATSLEEYIKQWVPTRIFAPGTTPSYSNYATGLAGYIVQRVSGQPFEDYIDEHIFAPLEMAHSTFRQPLPAPLQPLMSKGYESGEDEPKDFEIVNPAPAGSMSASGEDMGNFMIAHLQDGAFKSNRILQAETARQMHETARTILPPLNRMLLGFYETNINGHRSISHGGDTQWFHSRLSLFPDDGIGLFVSMNSGGKDGASHKIRSALFNEFADRYLPGPNPDGEVEAAVAKQHAQDIAGLYRNSRRSADSFITMLNLVSQVEVIATPDGSISVPALTDLSGDPIEWREIAPYVWRDVNGPNLLAAQVVDGRVVRFSYDPYSPFMVFDRVPWWKSSAWLVPALIAALAALGLTVLAWPISWMVRRYYGKPYALSGRDAKAHRWARIAALAMLTVMAGAITALLVMMSNMSLMGPASDWAVHSVRLLALIVFPIAAVVSLWNAWVVLRSQRKWLAKLWATILALSCLTILWFAVTYHLVGYSAHY